MSDSFICNNCAQVRTEKGDVSKFSIALLSVNLGFRRDEICSDCAKQVERFGYFSTIAMIVIVIVLSAAWLLT